MDELKSIEEKVLKLLRRKPGLVHNRYLFSWEFWSAYDNLVFGITKDMFLSQGQEGGLTRYSALDRAIRKVLEEHPELRPEKDDKRYQESIKWKNHYKK